MQSKRGETGRRDGSRFTAPGRSGSPEALCHPNPVPPQSCAPCTSVPFTSPFHQHHHVTLTAVPSPSRAAEHTPEPHHIPRCSAAPHLPEHCTKVTVTQSPQCNHFPFGPICLLTVGWVWGPSVCPLGAATPTQHCSALTAARCREEMAQRSGPAPLPRPTPSSPRAWLPRVRALMGLRERVGPGMLSLGDDVGCDGCQAGSSGVTESLGDYWGGLGEKKANLGQSSTWGGAGLCLVQLCADSPEPNLLKVTPPSSSAEGAGAVPTARCPLPPPPCTHVCPLH